MYIRETKTRNRKSGKVYAKHSLVESARTADGPRQRTVMQLGRLTIPRKSWPALASELERRLAGQFELDMAGVDRTEAVVSAADAAMGAYGSRGRRKAASVSRETEADYVRVDLNTSATSVSRSIGPELLVHDAWRTLGLPGILKELGLDAGERSVAEAVVAGRLVAPDSDLGTWNWIRQASAIGELTECGLETLGLNRVYTIADRLYGLREKIEARIRSRFRQLHPSDCQLFLFDLTNFHLEGQALGNKMARRGKSKQKRSDCQLLSLALAVDSRGFPLFSRMYPGNVSEPGTLKDILTEAGLIGGQPRLNLGTPVVVMDRGIATADNIGLLAANGISYTLIERGPRNKQYLEQFRNAENDPEFTRIKRDGQPDVLVKKVEGEREGTAEVLCVSHGKRLKEKAMAGQWEERACEDLLQLQQSVRKGNIKSKDKIIRKLGRLDERFAGFAKRFAVELVPEEGKGGRVADLKFERKPFFDLPDEEENPLLGTYVIESALKDLGAEEIWRLYMTLTRVEDAFHALKTDLGTRPVHHQLEERTSGHLFISVLAYSLLASIEHRLKEAGDHRCWRTIRARMMTHQRTTVIFTDEANTMHHIRQTGMPEPVHSEVYRKLGVAYKADRRKETVAKRL